MKKLRESRASLVSVLQTLWMMGSLTPKINEYPESFFHNHFGWGGLMDDDVISCVDCSCDCKIRFVCGRIVYLN